MTAIAERHPFTGGVFRVECFASDATIERINRWLALARRAGWLGRVPARALEWALNAHLDRLQPEWVEKTHNLVTNAGLTYTTGVSFLAVAQIASWFIGLINNTPAPNIVAADTAASHAGWAEWTGYSEANRQAWNGVAGAAGAATNAASRGVFTMNAGGTVAGAFVISSNTKGGTTGTLGMAALFSAAQPVIATNVLRVTYAIAGTDDGV